MSDDPRGDRELEMHLDRAGADEREAISEAAQVREPEFAAAVEGALRRAAPARAPAHHPSIWRWVAAAVLIAGVWAVWSTTRPSEPVFLGDQRLTDLDASGLFEPLHRLDWKGKLGSQERYVVEILDATTPGAPDRVVLQSPQLSEPAWMPSESDVNALPRRVRVLVRVVGGMDEVSLHADVSR